MYEIHIIVSAARLFDRQRLSAPPDTLPRSRLHPFFGERTVDHRPLDFPPFAAHQAVGPDRLGLSRGVPYAIRALVGRNGIGDASIRPSRRKPWCFVGGQPKEGSRTPREAVSHCSGAGQAGSLATRHRTFVLLACRRDRDSRRQWPRGVYLQVSRRKGVPRRRTRQTVFRRIRESLGEGPSRRAHDAPAVQGSEGPCFRRDGRRPV